MRQPRVQVAPEVARFVGPALVAELTGEVPGNLRCSVCGRTTSSGPGSEVSLVVTAGHQDVFAVGWAHPGCSRSRIIADAASAAPAVGMSGATWLRRCDVDPAPVLLLGSQVRILQITPGGDPRDLLLANLLSSGFTLLTSPYQAMPTVADFRFHQGWRRVVIDDSDGLVLYAGSPAPSRAWLAAARRGGRIGVVLAAGIDFRPGGDHSADVARATRSGRVVCATVLAPAR